MILEGLDKTAFIHFGLNKQKITAKLNDTVNVWNDNYTECDVDVDLDLPFKKNNENKFVATCNSLGIFNVKEDSNGQIIQITVE